jgi:hypothetical protein
MRIANGVVLLEMDHSIGIKNSYRWHPYVHWDVLVLMAVWVLFFTMEYKWLSLYAGLRSCESPHISKTRKKGNVEMPVYFLSDTPRDALICSPRSQNVRQVSETARATQWACAAASTIRCDIDVPRAILTSTLVSISLQNNTWNNTQTASPLGVSCFVIATNTAA